MATTPTVDEVTNALGVTGTEIAIKRSENSKEGKDFNPDSRVGVIPEDVWQKHKEAGKELPQ